MTAQRIRGVPQRSPGAGAIAWVVALLSLAGASRIGATEVEATVGCADARQKARGSAVEQPLPQEGDARRDGEWVALLGDQGAVGFAPTNKNILICGSVRMETLSGKLSTTPGNRIVAVREKLDYSANNNLLSQDQFGDCEVVFEFLLGKDSNSGIKLQERYEIQLYDSHGVAEPSATDCGGVYPRWVFKQGGGIRYVDKGVPPLCNAALPAGEWQELRVVFRAPRFNSEGEKTANAIFVKVTLNGKVVQQDVELESPTGNASSPLAEVPTAPLYFQMDHGPVAFRAIRVRTL
ncbi:MAG: DUF1080 domain-containing protein [Pirellulales bacterium]|nr:DUF1080 domain-containing protein [Pirellulales bacterium]